MALLGELPSCRCMSLPPSSSKPWHSCKHTAPEASLLTQPAHVCSIALGAQLAEGRDCQSPCSASRAQLLCTGQAQDLPGAEASLPGDCGPRLAPPGYAARPEPRALHLDPLHACSQAGPVQRAASQGLHHEPDVAPAHAALRALTAPFHIFEFDFAAPPPGGRSAQVQVNPDACRSGIHAAFAAAYGRLVKVLRACMTAKL